jgi:hypothetical protein
MKTLLVATKDSLRKHAGREVDDYVVVKAVLAPDEMPAVANEIRNKIRMMVLEAEREGDLERTLKVEVDATPPYRVILVELADAMAASERLEIHLPPDFVRSEDDEEPELNLT